MKKYFNLRMKLGIGLNKILYFKLAYNKIDFVNKFIFKSYIGSIYFWTLKENVFYVKSGRFT